MLIVKAEVASVVDVSDSEERLNVDLLEKTLDSLLPAANKRKNEPYAQLLEELAYFCITTPQQLQELIEKQLKNILEEEASRVRDEQPSKGVFYLHAGLVRLALSREFGIVFDVELLKNIQSGEAVGKKSSTNTS